MNQAIKTTGKALAYAALTGIALLGIRDTYNEWTEASRPKPGVRVYAADGQFSYGIMNLKSTNEVEAIRKETSSKGLTAIFENCKPQNFR